MFKIDILTRKMKFQLRKCETFEQKFVFSGKNFVKILIFSGTHFHPRLFVSFLSLALSSFLIFSSLDLFSTFELFSILLFQNYLKLSKVPISLLPQLIWLSSPFLVCWFDVLGLEIL